MPNFETLEPITVTLELGVGNLRVVASDRTDTVVEVRPSDAADESDVQAAAQVTVDYANGTLRITGPRRMFDFSRRTRSVDVSIELPSGSATAAHMWMGDVRTVGRLGTSSFKTTGHIWIEEAGALNVHTGMGDVTVESTTGTTEVSTGNGKIRLGRVEGSAVVKNSNGDSAIDTVTGDIRVRNANGAIDIGRAGSGTDLKTSNGSIRVGEVVRGSVQLGTAAGDLDIGIAEGTAAWLEVNTSYGRVRNEMRDATRPEEADQTVEVRGSTSYGDITIHRS